MLVLIGILAMIATKSYADGYSCSVSGASGVKVELKNTNATSNDYGNVTAYLYLSGATEYTRVNVMVYCYDAWGHPVDAKTAEVTYIPKDPITRRTYNEGKVTFKLDPNKSYIFKVSDAACR